MYGNVAGPMTGKNYYYKKFNKLQTVHYCIKICMGYTTSREKSENEIVLKMKCYSNR